MHYSIGPTFISVGHAATFTVNAALVAAPLHLFITKHVAGQAVNTAFQVFGMAQQGFEPSLSASVACTLSPRPA